MLKRTSHKTHNSECSTSFHSLISRGVVTKNATNNASELLIKNASMYTIEHDFLGTADGKKFVSHGVIW